MRALVVSMAVLSAAAAALAQPSPRGDRQDALRQVAGILDYIAGDYRVAVGPGGQVLSQPEYEEQLSLASDADALATRAGVAETDPLRAALAELRQALRAKRPPAEIAARCRAARKTLVDRHRVALTPAEPPSREVGARLYRSEGCPTCHGADGSADTPAARLLDPPPADFLDPQRVAAVSPHRAFYAISFGVEGTGMTGYPYLSDAQRWSLAFYVLSLRHDAQHARAGGGLLERAAPDFDRSAQALASLTDEDIVAALSDAGPPEPLLAYLRAQAPFDRAEPATGGGERFAAVREQLDRGLQAYRAGDAPAARQHFVSAYLDGFEPHEASLAARDPELVRAIEGRMLGLRTAVADGAPVAEVERAARATEALLAKAERSQGGATAAMLGALTITLREGLEIALLVTALLSLVRRRGATGLVPFVHAGWLLAIPAGLATWWLADSLLGGLERELAEGIAALAAAVVLLGVTHWLFGQITAKQWMGFLARRMGKLGSGRAAAVGVLGLSFVAAYREAFEMVLFFQALLLDAGEDPGQVWLGAGIGLAALLVVALVLKRLGQRLRPRPFMLASGVLLAILAFMLVGKGIRALQEAGVVALSQVPFVELPWIGVHATLQGLLAQAAVLLVLAASALWPVLSARRHRRSPQPAQ